jgi:hypothetical protein
MSASGKTSPLLSRLTCTVVGVSTKIELGQFYTRGNPFDLVPVNRWFQSIPSIQSARFIEPFAGSNSIVDLVSQTHPEIRKQQWSSFDIHPEAIETNLVPEVGLQQRDTLQDFPSGFDVCITNPPYLAKNSATRKGLAPDFGEYGDLFEVALNRMLSNVPWAAAIIPESFISRGIFTERLMAVVSLNSEMFDDTEFPVCVALFGPEHATDFEIWRGEIFLGSYTQIRNRVSSLWSSNASAGPFRFNDPNGPIGLWAIDGTQTASIRFLAGADIPSGQIKNTSRSITRITPKFNPRVPLDTVIFESNRLLEEYRDVSQDIFLTAFKGLRADGKYRRRIDWRTASLILESVFAKYDENYSDQIFLVSSSNSR